MRERGESREGEREIGKRERTRYDPFWPFSTKSKLYIYKYMYNRRRKKE
jgi:hypothetical protein